ncbi:hypothetical protein H4R19_002750, partial [Coemansia spiralis]
DEATVCGANKANASSLLSGLQWPATTVDVAAACQAAAGQRLSLFVDSLQSGNDDAFALDIQGLAFGSLQLTEARHIADTADYAAASSRPQFVHRLEHFLAAHALPADGSGSRRQVLDCPLRALQPEFVTTMPADYSISLSKFHALATARFHVADRI